MERTSGRTALADVGEDLLPGRVRDDESRWFVLHVKSRQEKLLAATLRGMGVDCYLPLESRARYYGRRKARVELPLFPGYLFLWGTAEDAYRADRTRRVANLIRVTDQDRLESELEQIHRALALEAPLATHPFLQERVRVVVSAGPFKGLEGVISGRSGDDRLILGVTLLGSAVSLEIEASLLVPID